jgi:hypothetical protein
METAPQQTRFFDRFPWYILLAAVLMALLRAAPVARSSLATPEGWQFTGNLSNSPDYMQYRVWMRQSQLEGPIVSNKFTAEPNQAHIPVFFYAATGWLGERLGVQSEFMYAGLGVLLSFSMVLLLYRLVRHFVPDRTQAAWIFLAAWALGGLETHLEILSNIEFVRRIPLLMTTLIEGLWTRSSFADMRGQYLFTALYETHFAMVWLAFSAALLALYRALQRFSPGRLALAALLAGLATLLHLYEGITLLAILAVLAVLLRVKKLLGKPELIVLGAVAGMVLLVLGWFMALQSASGLPLPDWRGENVLVSSLLLAYTLAWIGLAFGLRSYWLEGRLEQVFLLAWMGGCLAIALSGPFYPYPDRGLTTLQIPLYLVAGIIFFRRFPKLNWVTIALVAAIGLPMPFQRIKNIIDRPAFRDNQPAAFLNLDQRALIETLNQAAGPQDLLLVDLAREPWATDLLWLGPSYPGRFYCGHFFLCSEYKLKRSEIVQFYKADPLEQEAFLQANAIRYIYAEPAETGWRLDEVPGIEILIENRAGAIYVYSP